MNKIVRNMFTIKQDLSGVKTEVLEVKGKMMKEDKRFK